MPHYCAYPEPGPGFPTLLCLSWTRTWLSHIIVPILNQDLVFPHYCTYPEPGPGFPTLLYLSWTFHQLSYVVFFIYFWLLFNDLRWEVVHFVDIGLIVDHQCLNFLFIIWIISIINTTLYTYIGQFVARTSYISPCKKGYIKKQKIWKYSGQTFLLIFILTGVTSY